MFRLLRRSTLALVAFSLPIQGLAIPIPGFPITPARLITAALLVLVLLQFAQGRIRGTTRDRKAPWVIAFGVSYVVSSLSSLAQGGPAALIVIEGISNLSLLLYYFLLVFVIRDRDDLVLVMWGLILGAAVTALPPLLGVEVGARVSRDSARFEGLAGQANVLGRDMAVAIPIALALFMESRRLPRKLAAAGAGVLSMAGLMLSLSRTALVSAGAMWGLWVFWSGRRGTLRFLPVALLVLVGVVLFAPESVTERIRTMTDRSERLADASIQSRFYQLEWALRGFASNPVVGVGANNFVPWARSQPGGQDVHNVIHNGYLNVATEQGLFGLVPYLGILALTWFDFSRTRRLVRRERWRGDPAIRELGHFSMYLQLAFFTTLIGGLGHPILKAKTMWFLIATSTVVWGLLRQRVEALAPQPAGEPVAGPGMADVPLRGPLGAAPNGSR